MGLFSSLFKFLRAIFGAIFKLIKKILKNFWWIILIVAVIYFAPAIICSAWAPEFLVTALSYIPAGVTAAVTTAVDFMWAAMSSGVTSLWSSYRQLDVGTQLSLAAGSAMLIAPEETADLIEDTVDTVVAGAGAIASGMLSNPWFLIAGGVALWWLFFRDKKQKVVITVPESAAYHEPAAAVQPRN